MKAPRDIHERVERVREYHESTKLPETLPPGTATTHGPAPAVFRLFEGYPKTPLPTNLLGVAVPATALLLEGLDAVPASQVQPPQNLRTLATWLYLAAGSVRQITKRPPRWLRAYPSERLTFPCEIYVAAFAIDGLEPGFYHFSVGEFALRKLRDGYEALAQIKRGRPDLEFLKTTPGLLLVSTIFCRSSWAFGKRGYRHALLEAGHVAQNISTVGTGLGIQTLVRLTVNAQTMRELIGVAADADFAEAEAVHAMVVWADPTPNPLAPPPGFTLPPVGAMPTLNRPPLAPSVVGYGSILAVHEDCVAPGVAVREIRPPLTELSPLAEVFDFRELPEPDAPERGIALDKLLLAPQMPREFTHASISRDRLWYLARVGFRWGSPFPLFPDGPYSALIRPLWIITNVIGVDNGVWYYHPAKNAWVMLRTGTLRYDAQRLSMSNPLFGNASAVCFMAANLYRLLTEGGPDLYRLAHLEAGMAAQRIGLCAAAMGLATSQSGAFPDEAARQFFQMEKTGWEILYTLAIGSIPTAPGLPPRAESQDQTGLWRG
jgi:SagB-type dehydrogenase family enzyme